MVENNTIENFEDKTISTTSVTFGLLRKELISNLGMKRAKAFLLRYGWNLGVAHAKEVLKDGGPIKEMLDKAGNLHFQTGQITGMYSDRKLIANEQNEVEHIEATGKWIDSFEVLEHVRNHGISNHPVCHTLIGYAGGFTSLISGKKVYLKELTCRGMGHEDCTYELRTEENWQDDEEMLEEIQLYKENSFIEELNYTYEQLLEQKNYIEKVSTFHNQLTSKVIDGEQVDDIIQTVFEILNIPVSIEDLNFQPRIYKGISEELYLQLNEDYHNSIAKTKSGKILNAQNNKTFIVRGKLHNRIVSPIFVHKKIIGYVTFIYLNKEFQNLENDFMFIQRTANSAALYFLNEKTSYESLDNMKGYFFEQLLLKQFTSKTSTVYRGYYLGIDLNEPFYIGTLKVTSNQLNPGTTDYFNKIIQSITRYLEMQSYKILITQYENQIIILFPKVEALQFKMENILKLLRNEFRYFKFQIGLSGENSDIDTINESLEESQIALRLNTEDEIVYFENLSIIGTLINSKNMMTIRRIAYKELNPILQLKAPKRDELLKTIYVFLLNGGNLQQTINDLSLSMSGLMYRITRIEKLLNKELRNPVVAYELLIMLDALKILGEINV